MTNTDGTLSYEPGLGTCWTPPRVTVLNTLTPCSGGLARRAADYWTVHEPNGCESSFDPRAHPVLYEPGDEQDAALLLERIAAYNDRTGPQVGDFVRFADGKLRRISHDWGDFLQTSEGGSFYLGLHGVSFSGGLHPGLPTETFSATEERLPGEVWFFHHDRWTAHNGVNATFGFRVWSCSLEANR